MQPREISPHHRQVAPMIEALNAHNLGLYPPEVCTLDTPAELAEGECTLLGMFDGDELCAIGALRLFDDYGEIKRMFVAPRYRRRGLASLILQALLARLETSGRSIASGGELNTRRLHCCARAQPRRSV